MQPKFCILYDGLERLLDISEILYPKTSFQINGNPKISYQGCKNIFYFTQSTILFITELQ